MDRTYRSGPAAAIAAILVLTACAGGPGAEPQESAPVPPRAETVAPPPRTAAPLSEPGPPPPDPAGVGRVPNEFGMRLQEAIDRWELSDAERDCLLESGESPEAVASRSGVDESTAHAVFASGLARCLPDTFLIAEFGLAADDLGDLSGAELSCARQWLAGRGGEAFGAAYAGDPATYTEYRMGLLGCVPSDFLAGLFDPEGEDWGHVSGAELSCAQRWLLGAGEEFLDAVVSGDPSAVGEFRLGLARCFPGVWAGAEFDVEVGDYNAEELSCIQQWLSGVDLDVLETAATDDATAVALGLSLARCVPDPFLGELLAELGLDVGDLTEHEMSCLREWMARIDFSALEAATRDEATAEALGSGLIACVGDRIPSEGDRDWVDRLLDWVLDWILD